MGKSGRIPVAAFRRLSTKAAAELARRVAPSMLNKREPGASAVATRARRGGMAPLPAGLIYGVGKPSEEAAAAALAKNYRNVDGERHDDGRYAAFREAVGKFIPSERIITGAPSQCLRGQRGGGWWAAGVGPPTSCLSVKRP